MTSFKLTELPEGVEAVEAVFALQGADPEEGFALCRVSRSSWVTWRWLRVEQDGVLLCSYSWGHYFSERDEALRDLFHRAGFGEVEALGKGEEWVLPEDPMYP
jgi:hypothetical protein